MAEADRVTRFSDASGSDRRASGFRAGSVSDGHPSPGHGPSAGVHGATPLYAVYAERFGFSPLVLTAIFATYAIVLVPALVLFGRLSDRFGRRPVVAAGLPAEGLALLLGIDRFMSLARAITNTIGNAVASIVVAKWDGEFNREDWAQSAAQIQQAK